MAVGLQDFKRTFELVREACVQVLEADENLGEATVEYGGIKLTMKRKELKVEVDEVVR